MKYLIDNLHELSCDQIKYPEEQNITGLYMDGYSKWLNLKSEFAVQEHIV